VKDSTHQLMLNAEETLNAAEMLLKEGFLRDAVNRGYYAVFYIAEALLNEKDLRYSKHGTVHGAFALHYIKTGIFDEKYHKLLTGAFRRRMLGDYDEITRFASDEVSQILEQAWDFLKVASAYLARPSD
jgi:uncharacterized protein (UPF0332 family)